MIRAVLLLALLLPLRLLAATSWYVSHAGNTTGGLTNGTSWANAWTNFSSVTWSAMAAGDTLFIDGGSSSITYTEAPSIAKYGTGGNYFNVRIGQDTGHNGVAKFSGVTLGFIDSSPHDVLIDGGRNVGGAFVNPTNFQQVTSGSTAITNNIGFWIQDLRGGADSDASPVAWFFSGTQTNLRFSYIQVTGMSNTFAFNGGSTAGLDWRGTVAYFNGGSSDICSNVVFEYMYLATNISQQFSASGYAENGFDNVVFKFGYIYNGGEDHFEVGNGWTIRDSVIGPFRGFGKDHADMFQFTGSYIKVYNNDIRESGNALFRFQAFPALNSHDVWVFNNIMTEKVGRADNGGTFNEPITFVDFDPSHIGASAIYSNYVIANNLFWNTVSNYDNGTTQLCNSPFVSFSNDKSVITNLSIKAMRFVNNLTIDKDQGLNLADTNNYVPYTTNDFIYDYNTQWATNSALRYPLRVNYLGVVMTNGSGPFAFRNTTNEVKFTDRYNDNFELLSTDSAALNTGYNLSNYFNFDALNRSRNVGGGWDRGPLELQETNLVVYLSFDSDSGTTNALDSSGNNYYGQRFNFTGGNTSYPSNKVYNASGAPNTVNRPNFTGNYADFLWHTNAAIPNADEYSVVSNKYGHYSKDGGTFGITNGQTRMTNLVAMTVMCWARYNSAKRTDLTGSDYSSDGNATLVSYGSTATGTKGTWILGRYNNNLWRNNTRFYVSTNAGLTGTGWGAVSDRVFGDGDGLVIFNFPDIGDNDDGNTTNWAHYAVTFSNSTIRTYFNGQLWTNHTAATLTSVTLGHSAGRPYDYVGVGVDTHAGTPEFDIEAGDDYPNNGFMNGAIDQVRIYDRTLSWQEIINVANSEGAAFADAPTDSGSISFTASNGGIKGIKLRQ